jgi:hypothetical protein
MLLYLRTPGRQSELLEARFVDEPEAPEPVLAFDSGLRVRLSVAMEQYDVVWTSDSEPVILKAQGFTPPPLPNQ